MKQRIEFIDLAKGFCIILVIFGHISGDLSNSFMVLSMTMFRMPLYFLLSGLFFKPYNFIVFLKKKINKLIIPFLFCFLFFIIPSKFLIEWIFEGNISPYYFRGQYGRINLELIPASWFLICLFIINIYFYIIYMISRHNIIAISIIGGCCGIIGYALDYYDLYLPMWLDSSLTAIPFFIIGYIIRNYSNILYDKVSLKYIGWGIFSLFVLLGVYYINKAQSSSRILYVYNIFDVNMSSLYASGIAGAYIVLLVSKYFVYVPVISYIGRYSIIVLLTHQLYIAILNNMLSQLNVNQEAEIVNFGVFIIILILSLPTIKFCVKYLPYCFAQKDILK